jgi:hypothetical protein
MVQGSSCQQGACIRTTGKYCRAGAQLAVIMLPFFLASLATAEDPAIFKNQQDGRVIYSNKPAPGAKTAELPTLGRWNLETPEVKDVTCDQHGGVSCETGADDDGSVICMDGFRDAVLRHKFLCTAAKLEIHHIQSPDIKGKFSITVRNVKSVEAKVIKVIFRPNKGIEPIILAGPGSLAAYESAEFTYAPSTSGPRFPRATLGQIEITCENCPTN